MTSRRQSTPAFTFAARSLTHGWHPFRYICAYMLWQAMLSTMAMSHVFCLRGHALGLAMRCEQPHAGTGRGCVPARRGCTGVLQPGRTLSTCSSSASVHAPLLRQL